MLERFTDRTRDIMDLAHQEAQRHNHEQIGTEHILLAILKEDRGAGAMLLQNLDVDVSDVVEQIEKQIGSGLKVVSTEKRQQTAAAKKAIEYAIEEARAFHHTFVDAEHILLGLLRDREGVPAQVLRNVGIGLEAVRTETAKRLHAGSERLAEQDREQARCQRSEDVGCAVDYRVLPVWQTADQLARETYALTAKLPEQRLPSVASRLREAALSIPPNIAEANNQWASGEARWFLNVALGTMRELRYLLELVESLEGVQSEDLQGVVALAAQADGQLREFKRSPARSGMPPSPRGSSP